MRTTSKWTAGRETTSKGRRPSSNPARRRTPGSDHAIGTAVDVGSRYDEDDPHDEHQDRDGTEQETEPHLLGHVQPSTWAGVQPDRSTVGRAGLLASTSSGSPYRTVNPRGGFAGTPSLALAVLSEMLVAEVRRRGFEPEPDVLAHSVRCARRAGFKSRNDFTRRAKPRGTMLSLRAARCGAPRRSASAGI